MSKSKKMFLLLTVLLLTAVITVSVWAEQSTDKSEITIRRVEPQTVLYTVYRGSYEQIGQAIGKLYALAGSKGIQPRGSLSFIYLVTPEHTLAKHCLTEIRIPVAKEALKHTGTLGEMTDIKQLRTMEVAVIVKPNMKADYGVFFERLYGGITKKGYRAYGCVSETFLGKAMPVDFMQMKSEMMVPIKKISADD